MEEKFDLVKDKFVIDAKLFLNLKVNFLLFLKLLNC